MPPGKLGTLNIEVYYTAGERVIVAVKIWLFDCMCGSLYVFCGPLEVSLDVKLVCIILCIMLYDVSDLYLFIYILDLFDCSFFYMFLFSRLFRTNEYSSHPSSLHGRYGRPPVSHQHLQAFTVPHVHHVTHERSGLTLPRHYIVFGLALFIAAVCSQHELWTTQQPTGEKGV